MKSIDIKIYQNKVILSRCMKNYSDYAVLSRLVFFINDVFKEHASYIGSFKISLLSQNQYKSSNYGRMYVSKNDIYIDVNLSILKKMIKNHDLFKEYDKSFFFVFLQELGHALQVLDNFKSGKFTTLEDCYDVLRENYNVIVDKIIEEHPDYANNWWAIGLENPMQIEVNAFAFSNLSYLENLFQFEGMLI